VDRRVSDRLIAHNAVSAASGAVVVAIPVRNEVERIEPCLAALGAQTHVPDVTVLLLNNCDDGTEKIAQKLARSLPFRLDVVTVTLSPSQANAGNARRLAMQRAAKYAGQHGVLLTTDADGIVPPDWVARNLAAMATGVDAVCGAIAVDALEATAIPQALHDDDFLECKLLDLLDQIAFRVDPELHDPRPRHNQASGASLAISSKAFRRVGGIPRVASGEDRALIDVLTHMDARVRHDPDIVVVVSARLEGRAAGGMADTIRRRMVAQDEYCDDLVEPAADRFRRFDFRRRCRLAWRDVPALQSELAADLGLARQHLDRLLSAPYFGAAWATIQEVSPVLIRRKVKFADLPRQIELAGQFLDPIGIPSAVDG
jgi:glycosyltransferase involved in cell wall biosynthesis